MGILFCSQVLSACSGIIDLSQESYRQGILLFDPLPSDKMVVLPMRAQKKRHRILPLAESIFFKTLTEEMHNNVALVSPDESRDVPEEIFGNPAGSSVSGPGAQQIIFEKDIHPLPQRFDTPLFLYTELLQVETVEGATQVRILGRLWDAEQGKVLWEATGESRGYVFIFFPMIPASFEKIAEAASRSLIRKLPVFPAPQSLSFHAHPLR